MHSRARGIDKGCRLGVTSGAFSVIAGGSVWRRTAFKGSRLHQIPLSRTVHSATTARRYWPMLPTSCSTNNRPAPVDSVPFTSTLCSTADLTREAGAKSQVNFRKLHWASQLL